MDVKIEPSWKAVLAEEFEKDYFSNLTKFVHEEYRTAQIFPPGRQIFAAFDATPFNDVKVVILGQDPYHDVNQANGLCFSVNNGVAFPPSLLNIFKEIKSDIGTEIPQSGDLSRWAHQGVLLLNATLTVRAHMAGSHQGRGWETFTDAVIAHLAREREHLVFLLWGRMPSRRGFHRPYAAFGADIAAPVAIVGTSRIFRQSSFFARQRISDGARKNSDSVVTI